MYRDKNEDTALLQLMLARGVGARTLSRVLSKLAIRNLSVSEFVRSDVETLVREYGLKPESVRSLSEKEDDAVDTAEILADHGVRLLVVGREGYPARLTAFLQNNAPPVLFAQGNSEALGKPSVGFSGSRNASDKGLHITQDCARLLAGHGVNVVSGAARGVDLTAHSAAFETDGVTTLVLAEGILGFRPRKELRTLMHDGNYLILSEFLPKSRWQARQAMQRNRTICGLSDVMVIIESGLNGGTFDTGKVALELRKPLFVVEYTHPAPTAAGNAYFLERGAQPLRRTKNGSPNVAKVLTALDSPSSASKRQTESLELFSPTAGVPAARPASA